MSGVMNDLQAQAAEQNHKASLAAERIANGTPLDEIERIELDALKDMVTFELWNRFNDVGGR